MRLTIEEASIIRSALELYIVELARMRKKLSAKESWSEEDEKFIEYYSASIRKAEILHSRLRNAYHVTNAERKEKAS